MQTRTWVVVLTALGSLMAALDTLVVATALSTIRLDLHASVEQLEWTVNAYNLSFAVLLMTGAALGDRYGRRSFYALGLGLFAAASAACALAPDAGWLIAARAVQGAGAALLMPLGLALLSAAFPPDRRGAAIGIFSAITGISVASGPLIGGAVVEGVSWEWIFWLNVPIALVVIPLVLTRMEESRGPDADLDIRGLALVTGAALGIVWGLVRGNAAGWGSPEVIASLAAGVLLVAAFIAWEARARAPMLPLSLFRSRGFSAGNAAIFFTFAALFSSVFFYAQLLQIGLGYGPLGRRAAADPVDRHVHHRRAARRRARRPHRRAAADGGRPGPAGDRDGLARADRGSVDGLLGAARAVHRRRRRRLDGDPRRAELGRRLGGGGAGRQERGRQQHDARARRRVRDRRRRRRLRRRGQLRLAAAFTDGFGPAIGVGAVLALAGAAAALALPAAKPLTLATEAGQ